MSHELFEASRSVVDGLDRLQKLVPSAQDDATLAVIARAICKGVDGQALPEPPPAPEPPPPIVLESPEPPRSGPATLIAAISRIIKEGGGQAHNAEIACAIENNRWTYLIAGRQLPGLISRTLRNNPHIFHQVHHGLYSLVADAPKKSPKPSKEEAVEEPGDELPADHEMILTALRGYSNEEGLDTTVLSEITNMTTHVIRDRLSKLEELGIVKKVGMRGKSILWDVA